ncbi:MAG: division/cell wall cluster transcriptional repressor MraZ [Candidatus Nanopelagicales bacterium]
MFLGTHFPKLDEKGRIILPAKFRDDLAEGLVLTKGQDRCVVVWPRREFDAYAQDLRANAQASARVRALTRVFFSSAFDESLDRQGRLTVPTVLREYAGLDRELAVVGADTRVEIWDAAAWNAYLTAHETDFADLDLEGGAGLP